MAWPSIWPEPNTAASRAGGCWSSPVSALTTATASKAGKTSASGRRNRLEDADEVIQRPRVPGVGPEADHRDQDHHQVLALLGPVVDHQDEIHEVEQHARDQRNRGEETEDQAQAEGKLAVDDDVRHQFGTRGDNGVEPGA